MESSLLFLSYIIPFFIDQLSPVDYTKVFYDFCATCINAQARVLILQINHKLPPYFLVKSSLYGYYLITDFGGKLGRKITKNIQIFIWLLVGEQNRAKQNADKRFS